MRMMIGLIDGCASDIHAPMTCDTVSMRANGMRDEGMAMRMGMNGTEDRLRRERM